MLLQQPTHPQASSALPAAGSVDRRLASTATQYAAALQKPWTKPLLGATGIVFQDYTLLTNPQVSYNYYSLPFNCVYSPLKSLV